MDLSLIIFLLVIIVFVYRGYRQGLLRSLARIFALAAGYFMVIFFVRPTASYLENQTGFQGFLPTILASVILFFSALIAVRILFAIVEKTLPREKSISKVSVIGGMTVGLLTGIVVAIVAVWGLNYVREMNGIAVTNNKALSDIQGSLIGRFANQAVGKVVGIALSLADTQPEIASLSTALIESPAPMTQRLKRLSSSPDLQELLKDPANQAVLNSGDIAAVQSLPAFRQLMQNEDMRTLAQSAGLDGDASNPDASEAELAAKFSDIWQRTQRVKNNRRVQEIINDPEFTQQLQNGDALALLGNGRLMELAGIVFSDEAAPAHPAPSQSEQKKPVQPTRVYSWKDKNGRLQFSDKDPNQ
jgi:uncharacterized membrane protein required for colicin V production